MERWQRKHSPRGLPAEHTAPDPATPTEGLDRPPTHPPQLSRPPGTRSVLGPVMAEEPRGRDDRMSPEVLGGVLGWPEGVGDSRRA